MVLSLQSSPEKFELFDVLGSNNTTSNHKKAQIHKTMHTWASASLHHEKLSFDNHHFKL
jgi:hypothetical protein